MDEAAITFSAEWIEQFTVEDDNAGGGVYRCNTKNGCIWGPIWSLFGDTSMDVAAIMFSAEWIEQFMVEEGLYKMIIADIDAYGVQYAQPLGTQQWTKLW